MRFKYEISSLPKLHQLWKERVRTTRERELAAGKNLSKSDPRKVRFVVSYTRFWGNYLRDRMRILRREYDLPWLRVHFLYKRFANLREFMMGDLTAKLLKGLKSRDFRTRKCNCDRRTRDENGKCVYNGECRTPVIVYEIKCKDCGAKYIGNTQQHFKNRMKQHYDDVGKFFRKGTQTDMFAKHFVRNFESVTAAYDVRQKCEMKILQRIDPFGL